METRNGNNPRDDRFDVRFARLEFFLEQAMNTDSTRKEQPATPDEILGVESDVKRALKPVSAPPAFRAHLRDGLVMAAHHQQTHHALAYARPRRNAPPWIWLVSAAILGTALGFVAMRLRKRQEGRRY